jgi:cytochrome c oxidase cbb3-type subunit 3
VIVKLAALTCSVLVGLVGVPQAKLTNPVAPTPASVAEGRTQYVVRCMSCHGETGKGDGKAGSRGMDPKPSDLTDGVWKHGASDGDIYAVISSGAPNTGMVAFSKKGMMPTDIWNVVNYLKTLRKVR